MVHEYMSYEYIAVASWRHRRRRPTTSSAAAAFYQATRASVRPAAGGSRGGGVPAATTGAPDVGHGRGHEIAVIRFWRRRVRRVAAVDPVPRPAPRPRSSAPISRFRFSPTNNTCQSASGKVFLPTSRRKNTKTLKTEPCSRGHPHIPIVVKPLGFKFA